MELIESPLNEYPSVILHLWRANIDIKYQVDNNDNYINKFKKSVYGFDFSDAFHNLFDTTYKCESAFLLWGFKRKVCNMLISGLFVFMCCYILHYFSAK